MKQAEVTRRLREAAQGWKMNARSKAAWVKRLRSGDYKQGAGGLLTILEDGREYCCLGVLGHQMGLSARLLKDNGYLFDASPGTCPFPADPFPTRGKIEDALGELNDEDATFKQIALAIEKVL